MAIRAIFRGSLTTLTDLPRCGLAAVLDAFLCLVGQRAANG